MQENDLKEPVFGSAAYFNSGGEASVFPADAIVVLSGILVAAFVVGLCVKYKTRKDPAFTGTEGKIRINSASSDIEGPTAATRINANHHALTPPPPTHGGPNPASPFPTHLRTPSRSGDRKLPEIPPPQIPADQQDNQSNLYATVDDSRLYPGVGGADRKATAAVSSTSSNYHPYAKVKKKTKKVEHPYATVKKSPTGPGAATASSSSSSPSNNKKNSSEEDDDDDEEDEDDEDDDEEEVDGLRLLRPGPPVSREGRSGSGRSGGDDLNASVHSVIGNRQTTPLPPEPLAQAPPHPGLPQQQQAQQHFSGDSQDSSKGYTSITVREPVRHIHLPPNRRGDATYATLSETSDEMYAAIEDPTYIPTGTSQSNSDTYAVIDLPPEELDGAAARLRGAAVSMNPGESSYLHSHAHHHTYSKVDKSKKAGKAQPLPLPPPPLPHAERRIASKLEDMYAKVQKRLPSPLSPGEQELLDGMPMGASAITQSREALLGPSAAAAASSSTSVGGGSVRLGGGGVPLGGARPKVRSAEWGASPVAAAAAAAVDVAASQQSRKQLKSEINYSDYEVSVYDKEKGQQQRRLHHRPRQESLNEAGYETLPDPPLPSAQSAAKTSDPGYETVPDVLRQNTGWKRPLGGGGGTGYDSADAGYETVPNARGGNPPEDDYWKSNASSGGGYETLPESRAGPGGEGNNGDGARDPGYEELPNSNGSADGYSSWGRKRRDPGYESVGPASSSAKRMNHGDIARTALGDGRGIRRPKEPPYAKIQGRHSEIDVDSEVGYETIPGAGGGGVGRRRGNSEYDPGYEELVSAQPPPSSSSPVPATATSPRMPTKDPERNEQFQDGNLEIELDNSVNSAGGGQSSSLIHMSVQQSVTDVPDTPGFHRRSSVVVIEHVVDVASSGVSDVDANLADENSSSAGDKNVHIFV